MQQALIFCSQPACLPASLTLANTHHLYFATHCTAFIFCKALHCSYIQQGISLFFFFRALHCSPLKLTQCPLYQGRQHLKNQFSFGHCSSCTFFYLFRMRKTRSASARKLLEGALTRFCPSCIFCSLLLHGHLSTRIFCAHNPTRHCQIITSRPPLLIYKFIFQCTWLSFVKC